MIPDIDIEKITFYPLNDEEKNRIASERNKQLNKGLVKRLIASAVIFALLAAFELVGRYFDKRINTAPGVVLTFILFFLIFNVFSLLYCFVSKRMGDFTENYQMISATVTGKLDNKYYIFFTCDQGKCTTGISLSDAELFRSIEAGDRIKIFRRTKFGSDRYTLIKESSATC